MADSKDDVVTAQSEEPESLDEESVDEGDEKEIAVYDFVTEPTFYLKTKSAKFGVERKMLIKHSPVFQAMLDGDKDAKEIPITDFEDDDILQVMRYIYTPDWIPKYVPSDTKFYISMLPFAFRYEMGLVLSFCEEGMMKTYSMSTKFIQRADQFKLVRLRDFAQDEVAGHKKPLDKYDKAMLMDCSKEMLVDLIFAQNKCWIQKK